MRSRGRNRSGVEIETGRRGSRLAPVERLLRALTGAPAAAVVKQQRRGGPPGAEHAAAGREVIISRGQLVEIGGQFRMPDVIRASGCRMVEVGTTNKTHLRLRRGDHPETALLLHVHPSNYRVIGFSEGVSPLAGSGRPGAAGDPGSQRPRKRLVFRHRALGSPPSPPCPPNRRDGRRPRHLQRRQAPGRSSSRAAPRRRGG